MALNEVQYDVEAVRREWVGKVVRTSRGRYPVEYDPIRRTCHMVEDTNPLFLDPTYARTDGPYGEVIAPPSLIGYFAGNGPWPPAPEAAPVPGPYFAYGVPVLGDRGINMSIAWEYFEPVKVGDQLSSEMSIADVFVKPIRLDPMAVWIVTETKYTNQHGKVVALHRNTVLTHRPPQEVEA